MYFFVCAIAASVASRALANAAKRSAGNCSFAASVNGPPRKLRRPCKLLSAGDAVEVAGVGDERVARRDVRGRAGEPLDDFLPRGGDVGLGSARGAGDGQVQKLRVDRADDRQRWRGWILLIGLVDRYCRS
jgi:hypothetical protein